MAGSAGMETVGVLSSVWHLGVGPVSTLARCLEGERHPSSPVWNRRWLLEGQRKGMSAGRPVALWPPAVPWDSPGEPPAAAGETSALWSASASFHRPEVNARGFYDSAKGD